VNIAQETLLPERLPNFLAPGIFETASRKRGKEFFLRLIRIQDLELAGVFH